MIHLVLTLALLGFVLWLIFTYVPMPQPIKITIIALVTVVVIIWLMDTFNIADIPLYRFNR